VPQEHGQDCFSWREGRELAYKLIFRPWKNNFIDRLMAFRIEEYIFGK
jgi:hypothetical protein